MRVRVWDAWAPDGEDPALTNSHWIAQHTITALSSAAIVPESISGAHFDRSHILADLRNPTYQGFLFFGHGRAHVLFRETSGPRALPIPLITSQDMVLLGARFFVAFACLSGKELAVEAAAAGVPAYLGYCEKVSVEWTVEHLPAELEALLVELVTLASLRVALGERSRLALRRAVKRASDRVLEYFEDHTLDNWVDQTGLLMLATTLHRDLVFEGAAVEE